MAARDAFPAAEVRRHLLADPRGVAECLPATTAERRAALADAAKLIVIVLAELSPTAGTGPRVSPAWRDDDGTVKWD